MKFTLINTDKTVRLSSLIESGDVSDSNVIVIYDTDGSFITKGNWFQDNILWFADRFGMSSKAGTGNTVSFKLV